MRGFALVEDAELRRQAEGGDAVDDAEVDGLGAVAGFLVELGDWNAEDFRCGEGVDVLAGAVGVEQERVLGEVGHEAELDLRVVGGHEQVAGGRDEGGANLAAEGGADGDVLQIGIGGREPTGGGADLVEGGVDAAFRVDEVGQRIQVGGAELGELAVFEDERGDGVMLGEFFEDVLRGGDDLALAVLHGLGELHLVEEDVAELLGRVDVEAISGLGVDALGEGVHLDGEARGHGGEDAGVDADAGLFHSQEDGDERQVHGAVDMAEGRGLDGTGTCGWGGGRRVAFGDLPGEDAGETHDGGGGFREAVGVGGIELGGLVDERAVGGARGDVG